MPPSERIPVAGDRAPSSSSSCCCCCCCSCDCALGGGRIDRRCRRTVPSNSGSDVPAKAERTDGPGSSTAFSSAQKPTSTAACTPSPADGGAVVAPALPPRSVPLPPTRERRAPPTEAAPSSTRRASSALSGADAAASQAAVAATAAAAAAASLCCNARIQLTSGVTACDTSTTCSDLTSSPASRSTNVARQKGNVYVGTRKPCCSTSVVTIATKVTGSSDREGTKKREAAPAVKAGLKPNRPACNDATLAPSAAPTRYPVAEPKSSARASRRDDKATATTMPMPAGAEATRKICETPRAVPPRKRSRVGSSRRSVFTATRLLSVACTVS
mmetsp:Transcript_11875/g.37738  ORF Transcript_11875/g.37738 Transcript_11875/m.37738 type:complete len:330 (-) Transcript_11875:829-1818(-)